MIISKWLNDATKLLKEVGIKSARLDCLLLLEDELQKSREWLLAHDSHQLSMTELSNLNKKVERRVKREPLAYIRGTQEFYGRAFYVSEDVLIPRPESESVINLLLSSKAQRPTSILDIGTGSGCLAITAKLEFPDVKVIASDISISALKVARANAKELSADIEFINCDLLPTANYQLPTTILANLPYVPSGLITSPEIEKEPALALFSGNDGLDLYRKFWNQVEDLNFKPEHIITESLKDQHEEMVVLAEKAGFTLEKTETLAQLFSAL